MHLVKKRLKNTSRPSKAIWMLSCRFLCPGSSGIFTKSSVCSSLDGVSYSTDRMTFTAAPPPTNSRCDTTLATLLSAGSEPALWKAVVSHSAPPARSCSGVWGKSSPKCAPGWLAVMSCTSPGMYGPSVRASSAGSPVGAGTSARTALAASASSGGSGSWGGSGSAAAGGSPSLLSSRALPLSRLTLTQPVLGPVPARRS
mmetsp:Transcript_5493/g.16503  ORF Transcript_5493/g.16503 Transcript_5493/m.16503 type:complete len:200 (+) Transcript_5493:1107-1706(+)